jgi:sarcosine oxidase subunit alpha
VTGHRLAGGGRIDRSRPLAFRFNGRDYGGFAGDTLASALLANGVRVIGRSFKYHRPRGLIAAGVEECNAIVQLGGTEDAPNMVATRVALRDGLEARSVNCWPSLEFDIGGINDRLGRLLPAGFYYKTFMGPNGFWPLYEWFIRRAAGLGRTPTTPDRLRYEKRYDHCDVLVTGAGPAGLMAALAAGRAGARVMLIDERAEPGGMLLDAPAEIDGRPALDWVAAVTAELDAMANVRRLADATVFGYYDHNLIGVVERAPGRPGVRERLRKVRAARVVLAAGAIERPLVFPDNDRPGVMLAAAALAYVRRWGVAPGRRAVIVTNNSGAYDTALHLQAHGIEIAAIADLRAAPPDDAATAAQHHGIRVHAGHGVTGVDGPTGVTSVRIAPMGQAAGTRVDCDLVLMAGGWTPTVHLFSQSGGKLQWDGAQGCPVPGRSVQAERSVGACTGQFSLTDALANGIAAGVGAACAVGFEGRPFAPPAASDNRPLDLAPIWEVPSVRGARAFIDFQNDVTAADIRLADREGYRSIEHVKRYTTVGMAIDQGKTGNLNLIDVLARARGVGSSAIGTTTYRPPYTPVSFGTLAGQDAGPLILPIRETPMTPWHITAGAVMYEAAATWRRPGYYPHQGEDMEQAALRESRAVRTGLGIYDSSPLGKFELRGPDAAAFLDRIYCTRIVDLPPGRIRYGLMLREDGRLFDDGTVLHLGPDHFFITTTTGNADAVYGWLERWHQCEWPELKVWITPVTTYWANAVVCGPLARDLMARVTTGINLDRKAFPFMAVREGRVAGLAARIMRVSFTGELSFEVNVPARHGLALWQALMAAGRDLGITPVGSEASHVLRVEKGYISVGHEADGMATPDDLGLSRLVAMDKPDFIGKRSLAMPAWAVDPRRQMVGLLPENPKVLLPEGAPVMPQGGGRDPLDPLGFVTASAMGPALGRGLSLAMIENGRGLIGQTIELSARAGGQRARIVDPVFYDPQGARLRS